MNQMVLDYFGVLVREYFEIARAIAVVYFLTYAKIQKKGFSILIVIVISILLPFLAFTPLKSMVVFSFYVLSFCILVKTESKLWYLIFVNLFTTICDLIVVVFTYTAFSINILKTEVFKNIVLANSLEFAFVVTVCIITRLLVGKPKGNYIIEKKSYAIIIVMAILLFFNAGSMSLIVVEEANAQVRNACIVANLFFMVITLLICYSQLFLNGEKDRYRVQAEFQKKINQSELAYFEKQKEYYNRMRKNKHDMNMYLTAIEGYINNNEGEKAIKIIEEVNERLVDKQRIIECGNTVVGILLTDCMLEAEKNNIIFSVDGYIFGKLEIDEFDLIKIMGNALKNALEECTRVKENRSIEIVIHCDENSVMIDIANSTNKMDGIYELDFETEKKNKEEHGWGLKNIADSIGRYDNMDYYMECKNNVFHTAIILPTSVSIESGSFLND